MYRCIDPQPEAPRETASQEVSMPCHRHHTAHRCLLTLSPDQQACLCHVPAMPAAFLTVALAWSNLSTPPLRDCSQPPPRIPTISGALRKGSSEPSANQRQGARSNASSKGRKKKTGLEVYVFERGSPQLQPQLRPRSRSRSSVSSSSMMDGAVKRVVVKQLLPRHTSGSNVGERERYCP